MGKWFMILLHTIQVLISQNKREFIKYNLKGLYFRNYQTMMTTSAIKHTDTSHISSVRSRIDIPHNSNLPATHFTKDFLSPLQSKGNIIVFAKTHFLALILLRIFAHVMTSSIGNIFRVAGHLCGEFTGPRWIPRTKASHAELWCFLWSACE